MTAAEDDQFPPLTPEQLESVWSAYQRLPKPALVHCGAGVNRTGARWPTSGNVLVEVTISRRSPKLGAATAPGPLRHFRSILSAMTMPSIYHISQHGREPITDVDSFETVEGADRAGGPGRYHVDEISVEPLPSGHTSRWRGVAVRRPDGTVELLSDRPAWTGDRPRSSVWAE
jgi:hypothetical protein